MKKKIYLTIAIFFILISLSQIPYFIEGISEKGVSGVNYGRAIPLFIGVVFFYIYRKKD